LQALREDCGRLNENLVAIPKERDLLEVAFHLDGRSC
jgi:hypothetical protein